MDTGSFVNTATTRDEADRSHAWILGDRPYGLEPLYLPHPEEAASADGASQALVEVAKAKLQEAVGTGATTKAAVTERELERVYWFRWMTGHHISFIVWRLLAATLLEAEKARYVDAAVGIRMSEYVRAYNGMLLYTGSCPKLLYNSVIRPSMGRLHHAFSGTWAPDYRPVRALLTGRKAQVLNGFDTRQLIHEVALSQAIHKGVSEKLVTGGRSLLQGLADRQKVADRLTRSSIFDCCFLTVRVPTSTQKIAVQLLRRTHAVAVDLQTNGLYPGTDSGDDEVPEELVESAVAEREATLLDTAVRVAVAGVDSLSEVR